MTPTGVRAPEPPIVTISDGTTAKATARNTTPESTSACRTPSASRQGSVKATIPCRIVRPTGSDPFGGGPSMNGSSRAAIQG